MSTDGGFSVAARAIGAGSARRLVTARFKVYATTCNSDALHDLRSLGCTTPRVDVTDETSMRQAVQAVEQAEVRSAQLATMQAMVTPGRLEPLSIEAACGAIRHL